MANIASAWVTVAPSFKGFQKTARRQMTGALVPAGKSAGTAAGAATGAGIASGVSKSRVGRAFSSVRTAGVAAATRIGSSFKTQMAGVGAGAAGATGQFRSMAKVLGGFAVIGGIAKIAKDGWNLADAFDTAEGALKHLMGSSKQAKQVTGFIKEMRTPIDIKSWLKLSTTLGYLGLNAKDTTGMMDRLNRAIVGAGGGAEELEKARLGLMRLVTEGRPTVQILDQISGSGMPLWEMLADQWEKDIPQVRKMVSDGAIDVQDIMKAMLHGTSDSYEKQNKAFEENMRKWGNLWRQFVNKTTIAVSSLMKPLQKKLVPFIEKMGPKILSALKSLKDSEFLKAFGKGFAAPFVAVYEAGKDLYPVLQSIGDWMGEHEGVTRALGTAIGVVAGATALAHTSTMAWGVAIGLVRTATILWTAAQWALNAALYANPIVLVTLAVLALAAGFVLAYQKSETFRILVNTIFGTIKDNVKSFIKWVKENFIPFFTEDIPAAFQAVLDFARNNWKTILGLITFPIGGAVLIVWDHWGAIKRAFSNAAQWVKGKFMTFWGKLKSLLWGPILDAKNAIGETLGHLKESMLGAVRWLVDKFLWFAQQIINGAAKAFGWVPKLGGKLKGAAKDFEKFRDDVNKRLGGIKDQNVTITASVKGLKQVTKARRSFQSGPITGLASGGTVTGQRAPYGDKVLHALAPGEEVISNRRGQADKHRSLLRAINAGHPVPGLADGGTVFDVKTAGLKAGAGKFATAASHLRFMTTQAAKAIRNAMNNLSRMVGLAGGGKGLPLRPMPRWTTYSGHTGIDLPAGMGRPVYATENSRVTSARKLGYSYGHHYFMKGASGKTSIFAHLSRMFARQGQVVKAGQRIGSVGSTGNSTGPHLHFEVRPGAAPGAELSYLRKRGYKFDSGGYLPTGASFMQNLTGKPEPVLTQKQWDIASSAIRRQTSAGPAFTRQDMYDTFLMALNDAQLDLSPETQDALERGYVSGIDRMDRLTERRTRKEAVS